MPLGLMEGSDYEEVDTALHPGDCLLMYSDGLVEAHSPAGQMLGFPRLHDLMSEAPATRSLVGFLRDQLEAHVGLDWRQEDDVTIMTLDRT
jgi:serine phosphatase RsbU (regulator of sigma subunit)